MIIQYPISFNSIYFIIANNVVFIAGSDTGGFADTNGLNSNSPKVSDINSEIWISMGSEKRYSDIFALGI